MDLFKYPALWVGHRFISLDLLNFSFVQERNSLGGAPLGLIFNTRICSLSLYLAAVKAITAAQLSMASDGVYSVTLDEAIEAMRLTAADMSVKYKETSLSVCGFHDSLIGY
jgi:hypothetical protein